jgi:predicted dehydrogenase
MALNKGFHVLCEKPLAISSLDCMKMMAAANDSGKQLFAIKQNRFNPPIVALKKAIDNGKLGKIFSVQLNCFWNRKPDYYMDSWKGTADMDGGTLFTQFSHFIDLLFWMVGDVKDVFAFADNYVHKGIIDFEDTGVVILRFDDGAIGSVHYTVNAFKSNMEGSITVLGEKGTVKVGGQYLNELEYQSIDGYIIDDLPQGNKPNFYGDYVGSMSNHDKVYKNVVDVLEKGAPINVSAYDAFKTVEIIEKIYSVIRKLS